MLSSKKKKHVQNTFFTFATYKTDHPKSPKGYCESQFSTAQKNTIQLLRKNSGKPYDLFAYCEVLVKNQRIVRY